MASQVSSLRPRTANGYNTLIRKHIAPELGSIKLSLLRADQVQNFYSRQLETFSNRTVQYIHAVLHKALDQAVRFGLVARNVSDLVDTPRPTKTEPTIYLDGGSGQEVPRASPGHPLLSHVLPLLYRSAGRRATVLIHGKLLSRESYHNDQPFLAVHSQKGSGDPGTQDPGFYPHDQATGLCFTMRCVNTWTSVKEIRSIYLPHRTLRLSIRGFSTRSSKSRLSWPGFRRFACTTSGIFAISYLINALHISPAILQQIVGHASPMLTLSVYTHSSTQQQEEAMQKMSEGFK